MIKNFVLDTNVLLHDPDALTRFADNRVIVPIFVIEEIDQFKKESSERGRNARRVARFLDACRLRGNLRDGVPLDNGGLLRVILSSSADPAPFLNRQLADNLILGVALDLQKHDPHTETIFITKDTNLRVRADAVGLTAVNYEESAVRIDDLYPGACELDLPPDRFAAFYDQRLLPIDHTLGAPFNPAQGDHHDDDHTPPPASSTTPHPLAAPPADPDAASTPAPPPPPTLYANEYVLLRSSAHTRQTALGRFDAQQGAITPLRVHNNEVWGLRPRNKEQHFALDALLDDNIKLVTLIGKAGTGKAQPLDAKVLTPSGWKRMGQLEPGHEVMTPSGTPARVLAVYPQGEKDIYRVHFTDGSCTECCDEHLWFTHTTLERDYKREGAVRSLKEIMGSLRYGAQRKRNHSIPITEPVQLPPREQPIDPYLLGCLLGDGSVSIGQPSLCSADAELIDMCRPLLAQIGCTFSNVRGYSHDIATIADGSVGPPGMSFTRIDPTTDERIHYDSMQDVIADGFTWASVYKVCNQQQNTHKGYAWISHAPSAHSKHPLKNSLIELGVWGCTSHEKFIPEVFLMGSVEQRAALLQGLMDTDGTIGTKGHISFTTVSEKLAQDMRFLVQSLGGTVTTKTRTTHYTHNGERRKGSLSYRLNLCLPNTLKPFRLSRKLERCTTRTKFFPRRYIDCVEHVGRKQAQCILIDHPNHLYLTDECIATHNTLLALAAGLERAVDGKQFTRLLVSRPVFPLGRDIGHLPGTVEEKLNPWMQPIFDNVELLLSLKNLPRRTGKTPADAVRLGLLQIEPLTFIRGRSIPNQYLIVDEAQNLTPHEVKTIITRSGQGTKIVLTGDPYQIDNPYVDSESNGLTYIINRFKGQPIAATVTLFKGERSELAELASNLL